MAVSCAIAASILINYFLEAYVLNQAEKNIENLLLSHKGIHHYVQNTMLPALYKYKQENKLPEEFYAPELFSSSFIVRNQHQFYNQELLDAGYPALYYKLAANNPRNPLNKADPIEAELIKKFNSDRSLKKYRETLEIDGSEYLYIAIPFLENTPNCMVCHGKRENAPLELQVKYPGEGGFNEKIGEIRAITSIRAPLQHEFHPLHVVAPSLGIGVFSLVFLTFFNKQLRNKVRESTHSLETEVKEKHEVALKLMESENYLQSIQNSMQVGLLLIDPDTFQIADVNRFAVDLIGLPREEIVGKTCFSFLCPNEQITCPIVGKNQILDKSERILVNGQGREIPVLKTATRVLFNHREYILENFIDISEQKAIEATKAQLENRLNQSQKMEAIGTLAGGIAHDFNNILSIILGYAELAHEDAPKNSHISEDIEKVLTAANRAKELVNQILTFSRQSQSLKRPLKPTTIIKEVLKMLRASIPTTIQIEGKLDANCSVIDADPTQIHQVLMNLCTNAFHAMEQTGGKLTVVLRNEKNYPEGHKDHLEIASEDLVYIAVSDTGQGMSSEVLNKIFDPFFTTKEQGKGTGLGLSTTFGIIKDFGGIIKVDSTLGRGTTFHIYLPASKLEVSPEAEEEKQIPLGNERILLVDDEELLISIGKQMLERLGYKVTSASRGSEALNLFEKQPFAYDLVITDQTMPGMTGSDLARRLMEIRPDIPVILCTGYSHMIDESSAKSAGIRDYALKPLTQIKMAYMIRNVLDDNTKMHSKE